MIALVTADAAAGLDPDLAPLADAMAALLGDSSVVTVAWDDDSFEWSSIDAAVIRSTWDYTDRLDEFLGWVDVVGGATRLMNPPDVIRWNADKRYLADLAAEGVPIAPTVFVAPGERAPALTADAGVHVVKPSVGAGSSGARRCAPDEVAAHVAVLHAEQRSAMVQPYLGGLDEHGETALCFAPTAGGGLELLHAFHKAPILRSVDVEQVGGLFAKEEIAAREPTESERALADRVLSSAAVGRFDDLAFARIDVAPHGDGGRDDPDALVVMEVELIEPSFYLEVWPGSADRLAAAFATRVAERVERVDDLDRSGGVR